MRVLVWGVNYSPEQVGIAPYNTGLCEYLAAQGNDVEMVTTFAYYPAWEKAASDRGRLFATELIRAVRVHRCWHYVPRRPSGLKRILHEASFVITSTARALMCKRADVMVVVSPPLLLGTAAWLVAQLKGTRHVLHIQDLQPDAAAGLGMLKQGWLIALLKRIESLNYGKAARVSVISEGMMRTLRERGVERLAYFPNWTPEQGGEAKRGLFRAAHGIAKEEFVLLYSGNIGVKQGLDLIVEAAALRGEPVRLILCGDGAARLDLEALMVARGSRNVMLLPLQSEEDYHRMMADADVCVISQRAGTGAAFFPSKLLSCAALGRPVLAVADVDSELARVVREEALGLWAAPEVEAVAAAMRELRKSGAENLEIWGRNGRRFAEKFKREDVLEKFERLLREIAGD